MLCIQRERVVELLFAGVTSALMREVLGVDPSEDNRRLVHISCMPPFCINVHLKKVIACGHQYYLNYFTIFFFFFFGKS